MALIYLANLQGDSASDQRKDRYRTLHFPMGLGLVSGVLGTTDHAVRVVDNYLPGVSFAQELGELERAQPDYILFSGFLGNLQYGFFKKACRRIRQACPNSVQICGGPMATTIPELLLTHSELDFIVIGEGEETILDLIDALERGRSPDGVPGIALRRPDRTPARTPPRMRMKDLTRFPYANYDLFDIDAYVTYLQASGRCWEISTSRGCYARCTYCKLTFGNKITFRPVDHIVAEMKMIKRRFGIDRFNFVDDNFLNSVRQVEELAAGLRGCGDKFRFRFQGRADRIDGRLARVMRDVGCFDISYGLESGSQMVIDYMGKVLDVAKAEENLKAVLDQGLDMHATFIVGMPVETHATIEQTKDYIRRIGLPNANAGILTPLPDTAIYKMAKELGLIVDDDVYCEALGVAYEDVYVNMTRYSDDQIRQWHAEINDVVPRDQQAYLSAEETVTAEPAAEVRAV